MWRGSIPHLALVSPSTGECLHLGRSVILRMCLKMRKTNLGNNNCTNYIYHSYDQIPNQILVVLRKGLLWVILHRHKPAVLRKSWLWVILHGHKPALVGKSLFWVILHGATVQYSRWGETAVHTAPIDRKQREKNCVLLWILSFFFIQKHRTRNNAVHSYMEHSPL